MWCIDSTGFLSWDQSKPANPALRSTQTKQMEKKAISQPKRMAFKLKEAAQLMGVSEISIRRAIEKGQLRACRAFRHLLIPASELEKLIGGSEAK